MNNITTVEQHELIKNFQKEIDTFIEEFIKKIEPYGLTLWNGTCGQPVGYYHKGRFEQDYEVDLK